MSKRELVDLDKQLTELQRHLDSKHPLHPGYEAIVKARAVVQAQIEKAHK